MGSNLNLGRTVINLTLIQIISPYIKLPVLYTNSQQGNRWTGRNVQGGGGEGRGRDGGEGELRGSKRTKARVHAGRGYSSLVTPGKFIGRLLGVPGTYRVSQGLITLANLMCFHPDIEAARLARDLTQSQPTDTRPINPSYVPGRVAI